MAVVVYITLMGACIFLSSIFSHARISLWQIVLMALVVSLFSLYVSDAGLYSHDRQIYANHFTIYYSQFVSDPLRVFNETFQQMGWAIYNVVIREFTDEPSWLLFLTAIIYAVSVFFAFKEVDDADFLVLVSMFCITLAPLYSISLSRQILAASVVNMGLLFYLKDKKAIGIGISFVAILIHSSAVLVPAVLIISKFVNSKCRMAIAILCGSVAVLASGVLLNAAVIQFPYLYETMQASFDSGSQGFAVALKGVPLYLLVVAGVMYRDRLIQVDKKSDFYWVCTLVAALSWIAAIRVYWLWRLSFYFVVPICVYLGRMASIKDDKSVFLVLITILFLFVVMSVREVAILYL